MKSRIRDLVREHGVNLEGESMVIYPKHLEEGTMIYCPMKWPTTPYSKPSTPSTSTRTAGSMAFPRSDPTQPRETYYRILMQPHAQEKETKWKYYWSGKEALTTQAWERKGKQESLVAAAKHLLRHPESLKNSVRTLAQRYWRDQNPTHKEEEEPSQREGHPSYQVDKAEPMIGSPDQTKR